MYEELKKGLDSEIEDSKKSAIVVSVITLIVWFVGMQIINIDHMKYENVCDGVMFFVCGLIISVVVTILRSNIPFIPLML